MQLRRWAAPLLLAMSLSAYAQGKVEEVEWQEAEAPPPPAFDLSRLLPFEVSAMSSLKFGIDPQTLSIGKDGILRYVMVATNTSGAMNAMYEGIRCNTGEYKTYARYYPGSGWTKASSAEWQPLRGTRSTSTYYFSKQGGCPDGGPAVRIDEVLHELKRSTYIKFDHN
jgi:hypothetical protein